MSRLADRYIPDALPPCERDLAEWLIRELGRIGQLFEKPRLTETFAEPAKPEAHVLLLADGVHWNPGSGRGTYRWDPDSTTWEPLE